MWIKKLSHGVLRVLTPVGPRYVRPPTLQRFYLLGIFRHFEMLPLQVLSLRQQEFIDVLCSRHWFISITQLNGFEDTPVLGTVEWRPRAAADANPITRGGTTAAGLAGEVRQRS